MRLSEEADSPLLLSPNHLLLFNRAINMSLAAVCKSFSLAVKGMLISWVPAIQLAFPLLIQFFNAIMLMGMLIVICGNSIPSPSPVTRHLPREVKVQQELTASLTTFILLPFLL